MTCTRETNMHIKAANLTLLLFLTALGASVCPVHGQSSPPRGPSFGGSAPDSKKVVSGIAWFGVLKEGLKEARKTGKPIMFVTAAPQCNGIPGIW